MKTLSILSTIWVALIFLTGCCPKSKYEICVTACETKAEAAITAKQRCDAQALEGFQNAMLACRDLPVNDPEAYRLCVERARNAYTNQLTECENNYNESKNNLIGCSARCFSADSQTDIDEVQD